MTNLESSVIQVTNVSPTSSLEQMTNFFSFVGPVSEVVIYPKEDSNSIQTQSKTCYVRFNEPSAVKVAQHLSNTVFIDRALIVTPVFDNRIPDECTSYSLTSGLNGCNNEGLVNQVVTGNNGIQVISTIDPRLSALGLPQYPGLPSNTDPNRIEEIRRTVQITNLDATVTGEDVLRFFNQIGEVKYVRMITNDNIPSNLTKLQIALVEFTEQSTVASALQSNSSLLGSLPIKVSHCAQSIVKPYGSRGSSNQQRDIEEAMRRVRDSQQLTIEQPGLIKLENILHLTNEHNKSINAVAAAAADRRSSRSRSRSRRSTSRTRRRSRSRDSYRRESYRSRYDRFDDRYDDRRRKSPRRSPRRSRTPTRNDRDGKYEDRKRHRSRSRESYRRRHDDERSSRRHRDRSRSPDRSHRHRDRSREREHRRERSPVTRHRPSREQRETETLPRREKAVREEEESNLQMDQDLIAPSTRGPSTPPTVDFKFRKVAAPPPPPPPMEDGEQLMRRSISQSPERRKEHKHSKEKKKKKEKVRAVLSSSESDRDSVDNGREELMEH